MTSPILVLIPPTTYCSGSYVQGEVQLNFRHLQDPENRFEKIWVTLRGRAHCMSSNNESLWCKKVPLVELSRLLWTHGSQYPPPGSDVLRLFFRLQLPDDAPPSLYDQRGTGLAALLYSLTTVAVRQGDSPRPWKQHTPIVVVPRDVVSPLLTQSLSSTALVWRTERTERKMRRALWGDHATVSIELSMPDIPAFPLFTSIPFTIDVNTITAPLTRRRTDGDDSNYMPIFPTPPTDVTEVNFKLIRRLKVCDPGYADERRESIAARFLTEMGPTSCCGRIDADMPEKEWVPMRDASASTSANSNKERGVWVQCARFKSSLVFNVPPTFSLPERVEWEYRLKLKVPFAGIGNDVEVEMPVTIVSGIDKPVPRIHHAPPEWPGLDRTYSSPTEISLPWAYWQGHGTWKWKQFNKGIDAHAPRA